MGHGDAFFSIAMAMQSIHDRNAYNFTSLGSATEWLDAVNPSENPQKSPEF